MTRHYDYSRDGAEIYEKSFSTIRLEADLSGLSEIESRVAVRVIHACGMVDLAGDLQFSSGFADAARDALRAGAPILCDANMIASGITRARLPADNEIVCTLDVPVVRDLAKRMETTRSAAAVDLWQDRLGGAGGALRDLPHVIVRGRRGGSAMATAAVNALASDRE